MNHPNTDEISGFVIKWIGGFLFLITAFGCQSITYESRLLTDAARAEQGAIRMTATELRLQLDDLAGVFAGTIERAADEIIARSANREIERHALLWKINAIPVAYRALFQSDPAVAFIDTWAFSLQMVDYFEQGPGRDDFGQWHAIALDASRGLESTVRRLGEQIRTDRNPKPLEDKLRAWYPDNPIERDFIFRKTVVPTLGSSIGKREMGTIQTVGSLAISLEDITYQLVVYMDLMIRQARWQAELVIADTEDITGIQSGLTSLNDMGALANRLTPMVDQAPDTVAREREKIVQALRQERIAVLASIEQQRIETLSYLTSERQAVTDDMKQVQGVITDILETERKAILASIDLQRIATLQEIETISDHIAEKAILKSQALIDHFFIRAIQISAILLIMMIFLVVIFFRFRGKFTRR